MNGRRWIDVNGPSVDCNGDNWEQAGGFRSVSQEPVLFFPGREPIYLREIPKIGQPHGINVKVCYDPWVNL